MGEGGGVVRIPGGQTPPARLALLALRGYKPRLRFRRMPSAPSFTILLAASVALAFAHAAEQPPIPGSRAREPLIDVTRLRPRILVEMRYATSRNLAGRAIYPAGARCLVRQSVGERLITAQEWLRKNAPRGTTLKIWDAYRPAWAHRLLWEVLPNKEYLRDPSLGGSFHTWGTCVDATLCDARGRELRMPSEFDVFTPEAGTYYKGDDAEVGHNVSLLQRAMSRAGFMVVQDEWWHFVARDYPAFAPLDSTLTPAHPER